MTFSFRPAQVAALTTGTPSLHKSRTLLNSRYIPTNRAATLRTDVSTLSR